MQELLSNKHCLVTDTGESLFQVMKLRLPGERARHPPAVSLPSYAIATCSYRSSKPGSSIMCPVS